MSEKNIKKKDKHYFPLFIAGGIILGVIFDQIPTGLCLGTAIGLSLDYGKK